MSKHSVTESIFSCSASITLDSGNRTSPLAPKCTCDPGGGNQVMNRSWPVTGSKVWMWLTVIRSDSSQDLVEQQEVESLFLLTWSCEDVILGHLGTLWLEAICLQVKIQRGSRTKRWRERNWVLMTLF